MMILQTAEKEYKIKFGYNCFCDTDLMERIEGMSNLFSGLKPDDNVPLGKLKEMFTLVRELIFYGCKKYNPIESVELVGNIIDDYIEYQEENGNDDVGIEKLFTDLTLELNKSGFLGKAPKQMKNGAKTPTDHLQKVK